MWTQYTIWKSVFVCVGGCKAGSVKSYQPKAYEMLQDVESLFIGVTNTADRMANAL